MTALTSLLALAANGPATDDFESAERSVALDNAVPELQALMQRLEAAEAVANAAEKIESVEHEEAVERLMYAIDIYRQQYPADLRRDHE